MVFPALSSSASEWKKIMPVVRSPFWYLGGGFGLGVTPRVIRAYCVLKYSCNSVFLFFERETSRRVTMWPLSSSNELLARIGSDDDSADEDSA